MKFYIDISTDFQWISMDISISIDACSEYMYPPNIRKAQMVSKDSPGHLSPGSRSFHISRGPVAEKLL